MGFLVKIKLLSTSSIVLCLVGPNYFSILERIFAIMKDSSSIFLLDMLSLDKRSKDETGV